MVLLVLGVLHSCASTATTSAPTATAPAVVNTAIVPVPRDEKIMKRHQDFLEITKKGNIDVLFLGDSITDFFLRPAPQGKNVWDREYGAMAVANFGISADRTQHVLWRIANGELDGISPKALVLLIGTNNTGMEKDDVTKARNSTQEALEGIKAVVAAIRNKLPATPIVLVSLFPREDGPQGGPQSKQSMQVRELNQAISGWHDGKTVHFLNMYPVLVDTQGAMRRELFMPDLVHPNEQGYEAWVRELRPLLKQLTEKVGMGK